MITTRSFRSLPNWEQCLHFLTSYSFFSPIELSPLPSLLLKGCSNKGPQSLLIAKGSGPFMVFNVTTLQPSDSGYQLLSFLHFYFLKTLSCSPSTSFQFLYRLFFHQLCEYPSGYSDAMWVLFSSAHHHSLSSTFGGLQSPLLSAKLCVQLFPLGWHPHASQFSHPVLLTCSSSHSLLRNHYPCSNPNQKPWHNLMLLHDLMNLNTFYWFSLLNCSHICLLGFLHCHCHHSDLDYFSQMFLQQLN